MATPSELRQNERRKELRKLEPVHMAPRVPGCVIFSASPVTTCGVPRTATTKVHAAAGLVTCKECRRLYAEGLPSLKRRGALVFARTIKTPFY